MTEQAGELANHVLAEATSEGPLVGEEAKELPNADDCCETRRRAVQIASKDQGAAGKSIQAAAKEATAAVEKIKAEWTPKQKDAEELYQKTLKQLKAEGHDAAKFVTYKNQVERLKPKEAELKTRNKSLAQLQKARREVLAKWDAAKAEDFRELQKAARKVSKRLKDRVRVSVQPSASLDQLETVIRKALLWQYQPGVRATAAPKKI